MIGKLTLDTELRTTKFENKLDKLESDLEVAERKAEQAEEKFKKLSEAIDTTPKESRQTKEFLQLSEAGDKASIELDKAKNNVENLKNKIVETKLEMDKVEFDGKGKSLKNANSLIKKLKRVGLAVFSIRSAYSLVSKASSAYLSQDIELAQKMQSVWVGLGSLLTPILEYTSNLMLKALGYLNAFIKALTGIDFVARANAKALNKQANAQKNLNKQLFSFDEINKLNSTTSTGGSTSGLIDIPELDNNVIKKLQDMAYWLKENWDWLSKVGIALGVVFGATKIAKILGNIGLLTGTKGLGKLAKGLKDIPNFVSITITLAGIAYIIGQIKQLKDEIKETKNELESLRQKGSQKYEEEWNNETDILKIIQQQKDQRLLANQALDDSKKWLNKILGLDEENLKNVKLIVEHSKTHLDTLMKQYSINKLTREEQQKILDNLIEQYNQNLKIIGVLEQNGIDTTNLRKITEEYGSSIDDVANGLGLSRDKLNDMIVKSSEEHELTKGIYDNIKDINNTKLTDKSAIYTITAKADTSQATKDYSNFFSKLGGSISAIFTPDAWKGGIGNYLKNIWSGKKGLATGGIVYNPGAGVPIGRNAVAGEVAEEGVLPLTNPETMARLGKEIGKWITLNMNITNQIDGRVLNKRLETIRNEDDFSTNGGVL